MKKEKKVRLTSKATLRKNLRRNRPRCCDRENKGKRGTREGNLNRKRLEATSPHYKAHILSANNNCSSIKRDIVYLRLRLLMVGDSAGRRGKKKDGFPRSERSREKEEKRSRGDGSGTLGRGGEVWSMRC